MIEILSNFTGLWWRIFLCGDVEMHDLIFTTEGLTGGRDPRRMEQQGGSAGLWDYHARIGGALGAKLTPAECPLSKESGSTGLGL